MLRDKTMIFGLRATFFFLTLVFFAVPPLWSQSEHTAGLIEGAKREGKLVWYTNIHVDRSLPLLNLFEKQYRFLKTQIFVSGEDNTIKRIVTEIKSGRWEFDVATTRGIGSLAERKVLSPYVSPESKGFIKELKDAEGNWTAIENRYIVIGYNTKLVSENEAPKSWEDLLDPRWKGKIAIHNREYDWYATLAKAWGKERAQKYMRSLAKQDIQWQTGHTLIAQLMATERVPIALVQAHRVESMKAKGAPVEWVHTLEPIPVSLDAIALSAKPKNPNAAKLFIDFVLSKKGQEMIRSFGRAPARSDVQPLSPKMTQGKLKLRAVPEESESQHDLHKNEFREIFGQ